MADEGSKPQRGWGAARSSSLASMVQRLQRAADSAKRLHSTSDELPIELDLGGNKLKLSDRWKLDANAAAGLMNEIGELQAEVERLREDKKKLEQNLTEVTEDKCLAEYKNQVLLEMLAVAQLDAEAANGDLKKEQLKCDALKWEVSKLSLERVG